MSEDYLDFLKIPPTLHLFYKHKLLIFVYIVDVRILTFLQVLEDNQHICFQEYKQAQSCLKKKEMVISLVITMGM